MGWLAVFAKSSEEQCEGAIATVIHAGSEDDATVRCMECMRRGWQNSGGRTAAAVSGGGDVTQTILVNFSARRRVLRFAPEVAP